MPSDQGCVDIVNIVLIDVNTTLDTVHSDECNYLDANSDVPNGWLEKFSSRPEKLGMCTHKYRDR